MTLSVKTLTAREYLRVSRDKSGVGRSTDEQHVENGRAVENHGWALGEPYVDTGSASRYARKARDEYDRLIADLKRDSFGADVLILWESSRGSRRVSEWALLLELLEERGVLVYVTSHGRLYDLSNGRDRRTLQEDGTDSEYEASKMSDRLKRTNASRAAQGAPHGQVPFGYRREYDPTTGKLVRQVPNEIEAAVVREVFERIAKGHAMRAIVRSLEERGVRRRDGKPFSHADLLAMVKHRLYIGERVHFGEAVKAQWPGIVDRERFNLVQRILSDPSRIKRRPGRANHLLSMIARCDICSGPVAVTYRPGGRAAPRAMYQCHRQGCTRVDKAELDDLAEKVIIAYLSRPDNVERLLADPDAGTELATVRAEAAEVRAELDALADKVGRGEVGLTFAARVERGLQQRLDAAERRETDLSTPSVLRGLMTPGKDVRRRWRAAPMSTRREVARILLSPAVLGELRIQRSPVRGQRIPAAERVEWRRES